MGHVMTQNGRLAWYLRTVPAILLACVYILIAFAKVNDALPGLRALASDSARLSHLLESTYSVSGAIFFVIIGVMMLIRKEPIRRERRAIGWFLPLAVMASLAFVGGAPMQDHPDMVMAVATSLVVCGTIFTIIALRYLGRHFGVVSDVRGLVTTGPYRFVRHPLYAAETITIVGFVIAVATPVTVLVFLVGIGLQIWRARIEEQALTVVFPEYRDYAARTPMLVPFVGFSFSSLTRPGTVEQQH